MGWGKPSGCFRQEGDVTRKTVRIAAGYMVVIGAAVGHFVHPGGFALSAFVGAGLVFAGVTDTCGMGMLIARMPWNRA